MGDLDGEVKRRLAVDGDDISENELDLDGEIKRRLSAAVKDLERQIKEIKRKGWREITKADEKKLATLQKQLERIPAWWQQQIDFYSKGKQNKESREYLKQLKQRLDALKKIE